MLTKDINKSSVIIIGNLLDILDSKNIYTQQNSYSIYLTLTLVIARDGEEGNFKCHPEYTSLISPAIGSVEPVLNSRLI